LVIIDVIDSIGCSISYSYNVNIPVLGDAGFEVNSFAYSTYGYYSIQDPIQFINTATGDFETVFWDFGDGNFSNEENPEHTYLSEGTFVITQTVNYPFGCTYIQVITLVIEKGYRLMTPNAFTPNEDGLNDYFSPKSIALSEMVFNVYDTWGSLIYSEEGEDLQGWDGKINAKYAENGNYYFTLTAKTFYGKTLTRNGAFVFIK
jgi:gliding motility-associated-like protein